MRYDLVTPEQLELLNPSFQEGIADVRVVKMDEGHSKAGKQMITVTLEARDANGSTLQMREYIMNPNEYEGKGKYMVSKKITEFYGAFGVKETGNMICLDFNGKTAKASIVKETNKESGKSYMSIKTFIKKDAGDDLGDEIPSDGDKHE